MKAAILEEVGKLPLVVKDIDIPQPKTHEMLLKVAACGFCHSDIHNAKGEPAAAKTKDLVGGHEITGTIEEVGDSCRNLRNLKVGDRAIVKLFVGCGSCPSCNRGQENMCPQFKDPGNHYDGGFQEYVSLDERFFLPFPSDLPLHESSILACAGGTAYQALKTDGGLDAGNSVAVFGCGGLGLIGIQIARALGATTIIGVDILENKLAAAEKFGATHVIDGLKNDVPATVMKITDNWGVDVAIDVTPKTQMVPAIKSVRSGGRLAVCGLGFKGLELSLPRELLSQKTIIGTTGYSGDVVLPEVFKLARAGKIDPVNMISHRYSLDQINEAFDGLLAGQHLRAIIQIH